jgi:hypothetical protein
MVGRLRVLAGLIGVGTAVALMSAPAAVAAPTESQTITFVSEAPEGSDWFGTHPLFDYFAQAEASSGLPVIITVDPASAQVCRLSFPGNPGVWVQFLGPGTCTLNADQPGDTQYLPAARISQSFELGRVQPHLGVLRQNYPARNRTFRAQLTAPTNFSSMTTGIGGVENQVVTFLVADRPVCSGTTDDNGVASCTGTIVLKDALRARFTASYAGNVRYKPVSRGGPTYGDRDVVRPPF